MYKKADVAVVIPLYRDYIEPLERISLNQVEHILKEYTIIFVMPEGMAFHEGDKYRKEYFEKEHFVSGLIHAAPSGSTWNDNYKRIIDTYWLHIHMSKNTYMYIIKINSIF